MGCGMATNLSSLLDYGTDRNGTPGKNDGRSATGPWLERSVEALSRSGGLVVMAATVAGLAYMVW